MLMYPSQHLRTLEYEPDDYSDKSSRDGDECAGSKSILLMEDDDDETVPLQQEIHANKMLFDDLGSDVSGWSAMSSGSTRRNVSDTGAIRPPRRRRPRPWDENSDPNHCNDSISHSVASGSSLSSSRKYAGDNSSGERTPLLHQGSNAGSNVTQHSTKTERTRNTVHGSIHNTVTWDDTTISHADAKSSNRQMNTASPTFSSAAVSTAPSTNTTSSFLAKLRRRRDRTPAPSTNFRWSGGFLGGGQKQSGPTPHSVDGVQVKQPTSFWNRLAGIKENETAYGTIATEVPSHAPHTNSGSALNAAALFSPNLSNSSSLHHASYKAAASSHFYHQEESFEDTDGTSTFINATFSAGRKKHREWFVTTLWLCMAMHFILMLCYECFLWYIAFRRRRNPDKNNDEGEFFSPPFWFSSAGLVYNTSFGPNPATLNLFGILNPSVVLLKSQYWRLLTALTLNSGFVPLILNFVILTMVAVRLEEKYSSHTICFTYLICALSGGLFSVLFACSTSPNNHLTVIHPTTLTCAGLTGISAMGVIEIIFSQTREKVYNRLHSISGKKSSSFIILAADRWGYPHLGVTLGVGCSLLTSFVSFESIFGGLVMGVGCGVFLFADMLRCLDENDDDAWSIEDEASFAVFSDIDRPFVSLRSPVWDDDSRDDTNENATFRDSSGKKEESVLPLSVHRSAAHDGDDVRYRMSAKRYDEDCLHGDASIPMKAPKKPFKHANSLGTVGLVQLVGLLFCMFLLIAPLLMIGLFLWPPTYQALEDSVHGCVSMHSFYEYSDLDDRQVGDKYLVCGETCAPLSLIRRLTVSNADLKLEIGSCYDQDYRCHIFSDFLEVSYKYDLGRDVYAKLSSGLSCMENGSA